MLSDSPPALFELRRDSLRPASGANVAPLPRRPACRAVALEGEGWLVGGERFELPDPLGVNEIRKGACIEFAGFSFHLVAFRSRLLRLFLLRSCCRPVDPMRCPQHPVFSTRDVVAVVLFDDRDRVRDHLGEHCNLHERDIPGYLATPCHRSASRRAISSRPTSSGTP